jgi:hypothetical protein
MDEYEPTPAEREALEALPPERPPDPLLEERVVQELISRGLLTPRERRSDVAAWRLAAAAALAAVLLLAGFLVGRWTTDRPAPIADPPAVPAERLALAASLQRAGSAYVAALDELASSQEAPDSEAMRQGREVALTTLYGAAGEVSRLVPKEQMAGQLLRALDVPAQDGSSSASPPERLVWF